MKFAERFIKCNSSHPNVAVMDGSSWYMDKSKDKWSRNTVVVEAVPLNLYNNNRFSGKLAGAFL